MTIHPIAATQPGGPPTQLRSDVPPSGGGTPSSAAYLLSSKLSSSPQAYATPTLPPGVAFVEEPSGIKIYFNGQQVGATSAESH